MTKSLDGNERSNSNNAKLLQSAKSLDNNATTKSMGSTPNETNGDTADEAKESNKIASNEAKTENATQITSPSESVEKKGTESITNSPVNENISENVENKEIMIKDSNLIGMSFICALRENHFFFIYFFSFL